MLESSEGFIENLKLQLVSFTIVCIAIGISGIVDVNLSTSRCLPISAGPLQFCHVYILQNQKVRRVEDVAEQMNKLSVR